jgi:hypothetical protein
MATNYPNQLDVLINPTANDSLNSVTVPHHQQHANLNDAVEALQTVIGLNPAAGYLTLKDRVAAAESNISAQSLLNGLTDVTITDIGTKDILVYTESGWVNKSLSNLTKSADISINGGNF